MSHSRRAMGSLWGIAAWVFCGMVPPAVLAQEGDAAAKETYDRWCAGCHGVEGKGDGPAAKYMLPRPRDFTRALYQIRSTASGQLPTDADILRMIDEGMPGSSMPGWAKLLSGEERRALVGYLKSFSPAFGGAPPDVLDFGKPTEVNEEVLAAGREVYDRLQCYQCHGQMGRGDGVSTPTLQDDFDFPIRATDLTENWRFNGGGRVEDIYQRMRTGLDGTPMPSQSDLIDAGAITDEELWSLAHYVRSLSPEETPSVREVIEAKLVPAGSSLPTGLADQGWESVERFHIPLVGQIILKPRWFDPRVDGVWVQALHNGRELVLRLTWHDPSQSPDPAWAEWREWVLEAMEPKDDEEVKPGPRPDRFVVQFPAERPTGMERPYFLMGDGSDPVYLWKWSSEDEEAREYEARGLRNQAMQPARSQTLSSEASFEDGAWSLLLRRDLTTEDESELQFAVGETIPIAFFAWDGDNGEEGTRGAVSSWYFVYLGEPVPTSVFATPLFVMFLSAALGMIIVVRVQRKERERRARAGEDPAGE